MANARGSAADAVHPALLPGRERRPGREDLPVRVQEFLHGQGYGAFQLPSSLLLAASFGTAALFPIATALVLLGLIFGITIASGPLGFVLLVSLTALWSVVFVGFMQLVALRPAARRPRTT